MNEILALILARDRWPGMCVTPFAGRPLVSHSIDQARGSKSVTRTVVVTDDANIAEVARGAGAEVSMLAPGVSPAVDETALWHAVEALNTREGYRPDRLVILSVTSPIRGASDIDLALQMVSDRDADSLVSVVASQDSLWTEEGGVAALLNRPHDQQGHFRENGSICICDGGAFLRHGGRVFGRTVLYPMSRAKSFQIAGVDDLETAESLFRRQQSPARDDLRKIKFLVFDFDGVWTTNQVLVLQDGTEGVLCNRSDGLGLSKLRDDGLPIAVLTAEMNPVTLRRTEKLKIPCVQVPKDKLPALREMIAAQKVDPSEVCYVGNDVNDIPCMTHVGLSIAVADAHPKCRAAATVSTTARGGLGAVREVVDWFLNARGHDA